MGLTIYCEDFGPRAMAWMHTMAHSIHAQLAPITTLLSSLSSPPHPSTSSKYASTTNGAHRRFAVCTRTCPWSELIEQLCRTGELHGAFIWPGNHTQPWIDHEQSRAELAHELICQAYPNHAHRLSVHGAGGAVGTTTFTLISALALQHTGHTVLVIDFSPHGDLDLLLNLADGLRWHTIDLTESILHPQRLGRALPTWHDLHVLTGIYTSLHPTVSEKIINALSRYATVLIADCSRGSGPLTHSSTLYLSTTNPRHRQRARLFLTAPHATATNNTSTPTTPTHPLTVNNPATKQPHPSIQGSRTGQNLTGQNRTEKQDNSRRATNPYCVLRQLPAQGKTRNHRATRPTSVELDGYTWHVCPEIPRYSRHLDAGLDPYPLLHPIALQMAPSLTAWASARQQPTITPDPPQTPHNPSEAVAP